MSYYPSTPSFGNGKLAGPMPPNSALLGPTSGSQTQRYYASPISIPLQGTSSKTAEAFAHNGNVRVDQAQSLGVPISLRQVHTPLPPSASQAHPQMSSNPPMLQSQSAPRLELLRDQCKTSVDREEGELSDRGVPIEPAAFRLGKRLRSSQSPISNRRGSRQRNPSRRPGQQALSQQPTRMGNDMYRPDYRGLSAAISRQVPQPQKVDSPIEIQSKVSTQTNCVKPSSRPTSADGITSEYLAEQRQRSKRLILELHQNGYTYAQVVQDRGLNPDFLRGIYRELGIDLSKDKEESKNSGVNASQGISEEHHAHGVEGVAAKPRFAEHAFSALGPPGHSKPQGHSSTASNAVENFSKVTHDRKDYVARLQALKTKSSSESRHEPAVVPSANNHVASSRNFITEHSQFNQSGVIVSPTTEGKNKAKNEELRRRLEVLKSTGLPTVSAPVTDQVASIKSEIAHESPLVPLVPGRQLEQLSKERSKEQCPSPKTVVHTNLSNPTLAGMAPNFTTTHDATQSSPELTTLNGYQGRIPGLFMTSLLHQNEVEFQNERESLVASLSTSNTVEIQNGRRDLWKRPVASDFDYEPLKRMVKLPFGQGRHDQTSEGIIIEVSDDDTAQEDDHMEGNHNEALHIGQADKPTQAFSKSGTTIATADTSSAGSLKSVEESQTSRVRPGSTPTPAAVRENESLKHQEKRIADLKRKIAAIEQKKRAKAMANGTSTPTSPKLSNPKLIPSPKEVVPQISGSKLHANSLPSQLIADTLPENQAVSKISVSQTPENEVIAYDSNGLPGVNRTAGVAAVSVVSSAAASECSVEERRRQVIANHSSRMELLLAQKQELDIVIRRQQDDTDRQMRGLGDRDVTTEGIPNAELQATKDGKIAHLQASSSTQGSLLSMPASSPGPQVVDISASDPVKEQLANDSASSMSMSSGEDEVATAHIPKYAELSNAVHSPQTGANIPHLTGYAVSVAQEQSSLPRSPDTSIPSTAGASEDMDMEDFYGSESGEVRSESARENQNGGDIMTTMWEAQNSVSSDSSEEYEPPDAVDQSRTLDQQAHFEVNSTTFDRPPGYSSPTTTEDALSLQSDEEYEPPDADPPRKSLISSMTTGSAAGVVTNVFGAKDSTLPLEQCMNGTNHLVSTKQLQPSGLGSLNYLSSTEHAMADSNRFTPYESPLRMFKGYRYHPDFETNIRGGFRSVTYSHNVDAHNPVCSFEAAGGHCNDSKCHHQHFREMTISDEKILLQLGTDTPGKNAAENGRYLDGLKVLVKDLRQKGINDSVVVAHAIADYRRTFLNDPTRVLKL